MYIDFVIANVLILLRLYFQISHHVKILNYFFFSEQIFYKAIFVYVYLSAGRGRKWDLAEGIKTKIANFPVSHVPEFLLFFSFFLFFVFWFVL